MVVVVRSNGSSSPCPCSTRSQAIKLAFSMRRTRIRQSSDTTCLHSIAGDFRAVFVRVRVLYFIAEKVAQEWASPKNKFGKTDENTNNAFRQDHCANEEVPGIS